MKNRKRDERKRPQTRKRLKKPPRAPSANETPSIHMKKKRSIWWDHFQDTGIPDLAECIYCQRSVYIVNAGLVVQP